LDVTLQAHNLLNLSMSLHSSLHPHFVPGKIGVKEEANANGPQADQSIHRLSLDGKEYNAQITQAG
jgi:hypothetical protein